jgi:hypothetical protein
MFWLPGVTALDGWSAFPYDRRESGARCSVSGAGLLLSCFDPLDLFGQPLGHSGHEAGGGQHQQVQAQQERSNEWLVHGAGC